MGDKEDYPRIQTTDMKKVRHLLRDASLLSISCHKTVQSGLRTRQASAAYLYE